jgi:hypothetical protein
VSAAGWTGLAGSRFAWLAAILVGVTGSWGGLALGHRFLLPLLELALAYPLFLSAVRSGRLARCVGLFLLWSLAASVPLVLAARADPVRVEPLVLHGASYRDEMFEWIRTGIGRESRPAQFLPQHALHFAVFCALSFATVGIGGLAMGCVLLNYMNSYVGVLLAAAADPLAMAPFAWPAYAAIRVAGYVTCATALARLALPRARRDPAERGRALRVLAFGVGLVFLDALLKALVAPWYGERLREGF